MSSRSEARIPVILRQSLVALRGTKYVSFVNMSSDEEQGRLSSGLRPVSRSSQEGRERNGSMSLSVDNGVGSSSRHEVIHVPGEYTHKRTSSIAEVGEGSVNNAELVTTDEVLTIREMAVNQSSSLTGVLMYCKHRILYPYLRLLGIMGLKPTLTPESSDNGLCTTLLNRTYFTIVLALLLMGYVLQYMTCFRRDRGFVYRDDHTNWQQNSTWFGDLDFVTQVLGSICGGNPFLIHVIPSIFHLFAFLYMVYLYRIKEDEQLQNLMERVFIQTAHTTFVAQKRLLRTLQGLVFSSIVWITTSAACQVVQIWTHKISFNFQVNYDVKMALISTLALSTTWQDAIQLTVIISYSIHCILLVTYFELLYSRVQQHTISLPECIKEIGEFEKLLGYLNTDLSPALGALLILDSATAMSSVAFLALKGDKIPLWDFLSVMVITFLWSILTFYPLLQAAKLAAACRKVKGIGHVVRLRPFGYQNTPQADLDSFLLFVSSLQVDVRILKIPISPPILALLFSGLAFFALVWGFFLDSVITLPTLN